MPRTKKAQGEDTSPEPVSGSSDEPLPPLDVELSVDTVLSSEHNYYHDFYVSLKLQFYPGTEEPVHHAVDGTAVSAADYHKNDVPLNNPANNPSRTPRA